MSALEKGDRVRPAEHCAKTWPASAGTVVGQTGSTVQVVWDNAAMITAHPVSNLEPLGDNMSATESAAAPAVLQQLTADDVQYCTHKKRGQHVGILDAFNKWVANGEHTMTVLRDDGLYRHLRFSKPNTGSYRFDLLTWPGYLTITGDMGCYTFTRLPDMFEFFTGYINTDYWAEKLAGGGRTSVKGHSEDKFKAWLIQDFWEGSREMDATEARLWWETLRSDVFNDAYLDDQASCHEVLRELDLNGMNVPAERYMSDWDKTWNAYEWQFEFCLAAIVTGIRTYKAHKAQELNGATK